MALSGWIKLHRAFAGWEWYKDGPVMRVFLDLLLRASHEDGVWKGVPIKQGQVPTGRSGLAERTGLSEQQVRTALRKLKSTKEITISSTSKFSIITLCNYSKYQCCDNVYQPASNQQKHDLATSKNNTVSGCDNSCSGDEKKCINQQNCDLATSTVSEGGSKNTINQQINQQNCDLATSKKDVITTQESSAFDDEKINSNQQNSLLATSIPTTLEEYKNKNKNKNKNNTGGKKQTRKKRTRFAPPSAEEVAAYCQEKNITLDPESFVDFYESKGWMVGSGKMKDWQAAARNWARRDAKRVLNRKCDNPRSLAQNKARALLAVKLGGNGGHSQGGLQDGAGQDRAAIACSHGDGRTLSVQQQGPGYPDVTGT